MEIFLIVGHPEVSYSRTRGLLLLVLVRIEAYARNMVHKLVFIKEVDAEVSRLSRLKTRGIRCGGRLS